MQTAIKERVLVVDDEPQVLVALRDLLSEKFDVLTATSGERALQLMSREPEIAVVIAEQRVPGVTGREFLLELAAHQAVRILLSGSPDSSALMRAVNEGRIFACLGKPWDPDDLCREVEKAAEHFRAATKLSRENQRLRDLIAELGQKRQLEQQLLQTQKMEAIARMAGGVAHDFNNLLVVIQSYGQLLLEAMPEGDSKREDLSQMIMAGERAAALTRQLLAFSRRHAMPTKVLLLNDVVSSVETTLRHLLGANIDLITILASSLGAIKADASQIEQVVLNLSVNARDAMPHGGKLTIETGNVVIDPKYAAAHPEVSAGDFVLLRVSDTGTGMEQETLKRIFEPFFTTKGVGRGTGLGLAMVYGIAQQNHAHVRVQSELGLGSTFEICFPRADTAEPGSLRRRLSSLPPSGSGTVLLVEDDEPVRLVAARILRGHGYTVLETRNPAEARDICEREQSIDLLLTDIVMPETSGPKLAAELVARRPELRVLYMSGYSGTTVTEDSVSVSDYACVEKPFTPASLVNHVKKALEQS